MNSAQVLPRLRAILRIILEDVFIFNVMDIDLHALRSGGSSEQMQRMLGFENCHTINAGT